MNWIKIEDKEPEIGQIVLVKGLRNFDLQNDMPKAKIGLVRYKRKSYSLCEDNDYYSTYYSDIAEWCEVNE